MTILVTGGAGFIGANFILDWFDASNEMLVNLDKLTYSGNLDNLRSVADRNDYIFVQGDILDTTCLDDILARYQPNTIINFAAETHVDRSIASPETFIQTNTLGTFRLLESSRAYFEYIDDSRKKTFRLINVSTDEVFGSLACDEDPFTESSPYMPNSPYAASKAGADHLVRSYFHTYGLPTITTNCSNNYGPYQFPEKLIPLVIRNALRGLQLPIYGDGRNVRNWLYVGDHCAALRKVIAGGMPGQTYNIGGADEKTNRELVGTLCAILDELLPTSRYRPHERLIKYVKDRPGHDKRYAIDARKIRLELGWRPTTSFESGLRQTVEWYLDNEAWIRSVESGAYLEWVDDHYGDGTALT